jgi:radical SAM superfamily enzyme YgiQ (UPF0313 family)
MAYAHAGATPMKVLFIWSDVNTFYPRGHIHMGIAALSAYIKEAGHSTELLHVCKPLEREEFLGILERAKADIFAFSVMTNQFPNSVILAGWARERFPNTPVLFGGHHPSLAPEEVLAVPAVDMVCLGEGEEALRELLDRMGAGRDYSDILNLWVKKNGAIARNELRPLNNELDKLPFLDMDVFRLEEAFKGEDGMFINVMAGRGCPFGCTYCCNPAMARLYRGKGPMSRIRSVDRTLEEIKHHIGRHPRITYVNLCDETFNYRKEWVAEFCARYKKEIGLPFSIMARPEKMDDDIARTISDAGCELISIGVESGNEELRRRVLKRNMTDEQIINAFALADRYGIHTSLFAMFGLPHETPEMMQQTIDIMKRCKPNVVQRSIFYPLPATELYEECVRRGWMTDETSTSYYEKSVLNMPSATREQIKHYYDLFYDVWIEMAAQKESYGEFDFLTHLKEAEVETENRDFVKIAAFAVRQPRRFVIQAHPPSRITYKGVFIPPDSVMDFDISLAEYTYTLEGGGVEFILKVNGRTLFKKFLDPKRRQQDRGWHAFSIDMNRFAGKKVDVVFSTTSPNNMYCTAGWGRPTLLKKGESPKLQVYR